jgi:hypothetical protein
VSDGLGILLALGAVVAPLVLAWFLVVREAKRREPHGLTKRRR